MRGHYESQDRDRLAPAMQKVRDYMFETGWYDLDAVSKAIGVRVGTVASKLRELCDRDHAFLGLAYERKRLKGGVWLYRLYEREPSQLSLLAEVAA
jgi:hypothetical protein